MPSACPWFAPKEKPLNDQSTPSQLWRSHRLRQVMLFVTLPGVLLGTASMTAAYSAGLMSGPEPDDVCRPVVVPAPARASFTVTILNATGRDGIAAQVAAGLAERSFTVDGIGTAPESWYVAQTAVVHHGPVGLDQALLTASQFRGAKLFADDRTGTSVDVVVGLAYESLAPAPSSVAAVSSETGRAGSVATVTRPCP